MKKPEPFQLTIPKPCHENWEEMTPGQGGNFCGSCQKTVIDFTRKSDAEVLTYFSASQGTKTCGRFREDQAKIYAHPPTPKHSGFWPVFVGMVLSIWTGMKGNAQTKSTTPTPNQTPDINQQTTEIVMGKVASPRSSSTASDTVSKSEIHGRIKAPHGQTHLTEIFIYILNTQIRTSTNENGEFVLQIPDSLQGKAFTLFLRSKSPKQKPQEILIEPLSEAYSKKGILIELKSQAPVLMGVPRMVPLRKSWK